MILIEKTVFLYAKRFFFYIKYAVSNEKDLTNAFLCCIFVDREREINNRRMKKYGIKVESGVILQQI